MKIKNGNVRKVTVAYVFVVGKGKCSFEKFLVFMCTDVVGRMCDNVAISYFVKN